MKQYLVLVFSLASFTADQKVKEIGIRKVLGASVLNISAFFSFQFLKLVAIAIIISWPITWLVMNEWLKNYAYRIEIQFWIFLATGIFAILISVLTIGSQTIKAALANPVDSLRSE